ncbi:hypothetical protein [Pseudomonas sp. NPDC089569]|uniref:hypothetical protein n=1 Tax=Pseudomonas sp. NPDC089569 TaxID=3390722 RepID=UPI003D079B0E
MTFKWLTILAVAGVCVGAGFFLYAGDESNKQNKYVIFNPPPTAAQKTLDQFPIDRQFPREAGAKQGRSNRSSFDQ